MQVYETFTAIVRNIRNKHRLFGTVFMDHAASTPIHPKVAKAMQKALAHYQNPGALYDSARRIKLSIERIRNDIGTLLGAKGTDTVLFTRGGTEANNIAIQGALSDIVYH
ncbi:MAG: hypothetical protein CUN55_20150, partial [Phototrophicales bacterium]